MDAVASLNEPHAQHWNERTLPSENGDSKALSSENLRAPGLVANIADTFMDWEKMTEASAYEAQTIATKITSNSLFDPLYCIGRVTDGACFSLSCLGSNAFIITSVGHQYVVYDASSLRIVFRSPKLQLPPISELPVIRAIAVDSKSKRTVISAANQILVCERLETIKRFCWHKSTIVGLLVIGPVLISYSSNELVACDMNKAMAGSEQPAEQVQTDYVQDKETLQFLPISSHRKITLVLHPETYINKILVAYDDAGLEIWNFRTLKHVCELKSHKLSHVNHSAKNEAEFLSLSITSMANSMDPDVIAVGQNNGRIAVIDIRKDELLLEFFHSSELGAVTSLVFSPDNAVSNNFSKLVSGAANGCLTIWNLDKGIMNSTHGAHSDSVAHLSFVPGQNVMLSAAADNSILMWIFDLPDGGCRILKSRKGPRGNINSITAYDENCTSFIAACNLKNNGHLWYSSTLAQQQNCCFSQKSLAPGSMKSSGPLSFLPPISHTSFAYEKHYDWPNIITCHVGRHEVYVWSGHNKCLAPATLSVPNSSSFATAVAVSHCGNYAVIGYENGSAHRFNLQSSTWQGSYVKGIYKESGKAHLASICKMEIFRNEVLLTASSHPEDSSIAFWELRKQKFEGDIKVDQNGNGISTFKSAATLVAVVLQNGTVHLYDMSTKAKVREFFCGSPINDLCFSGDHRWLLVATKQCDFLTFDIFSSCMIDWIKLPSPVLSLAYSFSGAFVYTTHMHFNGVMVWSCKHIGSKAASQRLVSAMPSKPTTLDYAFNTTIEDELSERLAVSDKTSHEYSPNYIPSIAPLFEGAITLSGISSGKINAIRNLELIKRKSEPIQPPKQSEKTPFFLFSNTSGNAGKFHSNEIQPEAVANDTQLEKENTKRDKKLSNTLKSTRSKLQELLVTQHENTKDRYFGILKYLASLSPSGIHLALSEVGDLAGGTTEEVIEMLRCFAFLVEERVDVDLLQSCFNLFLQFHGDTLASSSCSKEVDHLMETLHNTIATDWRSLDFQFQQLSCYLKFLTHLQ